MKLIKLALISIVVLFCLITGISLLLPSQVRVSRVIDIQAPVDSIRKLICDFSEWKHWVENNDSSGLVLSATPAAGLSSLTMSNTIVVLIKSTPSQIITTWQFKKGRKMEGDFNFTQSDSKTTLQWVFVQQLRWYPWEKFASIMSEKVLGPYMEKNLDNIKKYAEHSQQ